MRMTHEYEMRENMEHVLEDLRLLASEAERLEERANKLDMRQRQMSEEIHIDSVCSAIQKKFPGEVGAANVVAAQTAYRQASRA